MGRPAQVRGRGSYAAEHGPYYAFEGRSSADPGASGEAIVIKTRVTIPTGGVLAGSFIGESNFCPGESFRDEHGNDIVGSVARTFNRPEGSVTIGFSPEQPGLVQRSKWHAVSGSGRFDGPRGGGSVVARWDSEGASRGRETFTGRVG